MSPLAPRRSPEQAGFRFAQDRRRNHATARRTPARERAPAATPAGAHSISQRYPRSLRTVFRTSASFGSTPASLSCFFTSATADASDPSVGIRSGGRFFATSRSSFRAAALSIFTTGFFANLITSSPSRCANHSPPHRQAGHRLPLEHTPARGTHPTGQRSPGPQMPHTPATGCHAPAPSHPGEPTGTRDAGAPTCRSPTPPLPGRDPVGMAGANVREVGMSRAKHPCAQAGCPTPVPAGTSRCPVHTRARDKVRGTTAQRGYGTGHRDQRSRWQQLIDAGAPVHCARCDTRILPGTPWHLDHADDRTQYLGPSCAHCNLSAAGRAAHQ